MQKRRNLNRFFFLGLIVMAFQSCLNEPKYVHRDFFVGMGCCYYNKSLDSMGFLGHFGMDSNSVIIANLRYWEIKNTQSSFFRLSGLLRHERGKVFLRAYYDGVQNKIVGVDQILFSFDSKDLGKKWCVYYTYNAPLMLGDTIALNCKWYDRLIDDTVYQYVFKSVFYSPKTQETTIEGKCSVVDVSRKIGIIKIKFTNGIDTTVLKFYPSFMRLDSNFFKNKTL